MLVKGKYGAFLLPFFSNDLVFSQVFDTLRQGIIMHVKNLCEPSCVDADFAFPVYFTNDIDQQSERQQGIAALPTNFFRDGK